MLTEKVRKFNYELKKGIPYKLLSLSLMHEEEFQDYMKNDKEFSKWIAYHMKKQKIKMKIIKVGVNDYTLKGSYYMFSKLTDRQCYYIAYYGSALFMSLVLLTYFFMLQDLHFWLKLLLGILILVGIWVTQDTMKRLKPKR